MHINNKTGWKNEFTVAISVLSAKSGLSPRAVTNARKELTDKGRITWESRDGNQAAKYQINSLAEELQALYASKPSDKVADNYTGNASDSSSTLTKRKLNVNETNIYEFTPKSEEPLRENICLSANPEEELIDYWNQKGIVIHKKISNNIRIAVKHAVTIYSLEELKTAIDRYDIMYNDSSYEWCNYKWTLEKFLDDEKGVTYFFDDGQKWLSYESHLRKKSKPSQSPQSDLYQPPEYNITDTELPPEAIEWRKRQVSEH